MFSYHKNSYLQLQNSYINPRLLNRAINKAFSKAKFPIENIYRTEPPLNRLISEQPLIPCQDVDVTRRRQPFGRWALPILRRELHSKDNIVVRQAVYTICDLVSDPERGYEAIRLKIPLRITDLLLHEDPCVSEQTAICLRKLAESFDGKMMIVKSEDILTKIRLAMNDEELAVQLRIAALVEALARSPIIAECLVNHEFLPKILEQIQQDIADDILEIYLETFKLLCDNSNAKNQALDLDAFTILIRLLDRDNYKIVCKALDGLAVLTSIERGQKLALHENLLKIINRFLYHYKIEVCTSTASVFMFCTIQTRAKILSARFKDLPRRLIRLMRNPINTSLQLFCIKTLTNIVEYPRIRNEVISKYGEILNELQTNLDPQYKQILLDILYWVPYSSYQTNSENKND